MQLISNCSKIAGCKVAIRKTIALLHTCNKQVEFEITNITIYIYHPIKRICYINITKYEQNLYEEDYKTDKRYQRTI